MGDLKLFDISGKDVSEIDVQRLDFERNLQAVFERNLETLLGVRLLASEYATSNGGRMDSLGIDENGCPVIIEYKRTRSENVINQGLFYLDWLMDHQAAFELLVRDRFGKEEADKIEWSAPRLICIAGDFTKYDKHAVNQMPRNIELIRFARFGDGLLLLDQLTAVNVQPVKTSTTGAANVGTTYYKSVSEYIEDADESLTALYESVRDYMLTLGDDVQERVLKFYVAFKRIKNFACVEVRPGVQTVKVYLKVDPTSVEIDSSYMRDMRKIGHYGTGDLEIDVTSLEILEKAKEFIRMSYENA